MPSDRIDRPNLEPVVGSTQVGPFVVRWVEHPESTAAFIRAEH